MEWTVLAGVALLGILGTGHCVGMCGGFALAVGAGAGAALPWRHVAYQLGKGTGYVFIGVVLTLAGAGFQRTGAGMWQHALSWLAGAVMVGVGVYQLAGGVHAPAWLDRVAATAPCRAFNAMLQAPSLWRSVLIGWINGFLPCGLSLAALLMLAGHGSLVLTTAGAYIFTFATFPGLLVLSWAGKSVSWSGRRFLRVAAGILVIAFGVITILRGIPSAHKPLHHLFEPVTPASGHEHGH